MYCKTPFRGSEDAAADRLGLWIMQHQFAKAAAGVIWPVGHIIMRPSKVLHKLKPLNMLMVLSILDHTSLIYKRIELRSLRPLFAAESVAANPREIQQTRLKRQ